MAKGLVMIVDHDDASRDLTAGILNEAGYETVATSLCVAYAVQLLDLADPQPDLILMDACRTCHQHGNPGADLRLSCGIGDVPIIMLTERREIEHHDCAFRAGVQKYLLKPCDPAELTLAIEELLERQLLGQR